MELMERGDRWYRMGQWRWAAADYRAALARRPDAVLPNHALARLLAEAPDSGDPEEALRRAQLAARGWPQQLPFRRTLALAMCRRRQGRPAAARAALAEALRWRAARPNLRPDWAAAFDHHHLEVRSVLDGTLPDLPVDVFARE
jgi:tetratricopeptide (TPR) repeat protein